MPYKTLHTIPLGPKVLLTRSPMAIAPTNMDYLPSISHTRLTVLIMSYQASILGSLLCGVSL